MSKNKGKIFDSLNIIQISNASVNSLSKRSWNLIFWDNGKEVKGIFDGFFKGFLPWYER